MCDYIQRELKCGHVKHIVHSWCPDYKRTERPCRPNVVHFEYWGDRVCGDCQPTPQLAPAWESMIKRSNKQAFSL